MLNFTWKDKNDFKKKKRFTCKLNFSNFIFQIFSFFKDNISLLIILGMDASEHNQNQCFLYIFVLVFKANLKSIMGVFLHLLHRAYEYFKKKMLLWKVLMDNSLCLQSIAQIGLSSFLKRIFGKLESCKKFFYM